MKLSARNVFCGRVTGVKKGATTSIVHIEIGPSTVVTSSITNESAEALGLAPGKSAFVVIKSSDVIVGVDS